MTDIIGRVIASEDKPTTSTTIQFWVVDDVLVRPFDIVRVDHISTTNGDNSQTYAIITELLYLTDGVGYLSNYISSDFGDVNADARNQRIGTTVASAEVLHNTDSIEMPVRDGARVAWADAAGIRAALGLDQFKSPIPAGYFQMSNGEEIPVEFESEYLLGPEGAHLNIAGISGLATKTSYAMFAMSGIQQKKSDEVSILIFNVKGTDLLSIDVSDANISNETKRDWERCGLRPEPFKDVVYFYPFQKDKARDYTQSRVDRSILADQINQDKAYNYFYDVDHGKQRLLLLFSDLDDPNDTLESCALEIGNEDAESWDALREAVRTRTRKGSGGEITVNSWRRFSRLLRQRTNNQIFAEQMLTDATARQCTIQAILEHLRPGSVVVVDIEPLPDYLQSLVFGDVIETLLSAKLGEDDSVDPDELGRIVIFADELNKYAPRVGGGDKTLTRNLLEITERGRSLGIVLFSAEQFRSGVHERVLGNCSTNIYGRTNPIEIQKDAGYRYLTNHQKASLTRLKKGTLMLQHAVFSTSVIQVNFPRPAYHQPKG